MAKDYPLLPLLSAQQQALVARVIPVNHPGNLEGLFAHYVIGDTAEFPLHWDVNCATNDWHAANVETLGNYPVLAALGDALHLSRVGAPTTLKAGFLGGVTALRRRETFPEDRLSFAFRPVSLLGIALGIATCAEPAAAARNWLISVIDQLSQNMKLDEFQAIIIACARFALAGQSTAIADAGRYSRADTAAALEWGMRVKALQLVDPRVDLWELQATVLRTAMSIAPGSLDSPQAAIVWSAVHASLSRSAAELVLSRRHVGAILRRFESAMRRWRWDDEARIKKPIRWPIASEREVQDILWLVLRSVFEDLVEEETLPKVGHSSYRADFGIPSLRLLIEAKYARDAGDFKTMEQQVMIDATAYLHRSRERYDHIIVFIYDDSASVQEHDTTAGMLRDIAGIEDVVIVSRPSQLALSQGPQEPKPSTRAARSPQLMPSDTWSSQDFVDT